MKLHKKIIGIIVVFCILFSVPAFARGQDQTGTSDDLDYLKSIIDMIKEKYKGEINDQQLIEGALKGMFNTMDPYTTYYTPEEASSFMNNIGGTYEGVGISLDKNNEHVIILKVFRGSPAERAGLLQSDKIVAVDGESVVGVSLEQVAAKIRGNAGTNVVLGIMREGHNSVLNIEVTRDKIRQNPVTYYSIGNMGYLKIESFNSNAAYFMAQALKEFDIKKANNIILDLRGNPGGEVTQAVEVARSFVPEGLITKLDFKSGSTPDREYFSFLKKPAYNLYILVNGSTASAAEIVAGAVQDADSGILIGTHTFGKARVQSLIPLLTPEAYSKYEEQLGIKVVDAYELVTSHGVSPLESEIMGWTKITTGVYLTPGGRMIDGTGLAPDIEVDDPVPVEELDISSIERLSSESILKLNNEGTDIYNAEKILKLLGYIDKPDYLFDSKTEEGIKSFQEYAGIYPTGNLDIVTQGSLNIQLYNLQLKYDLQFSKAVELITKGDGSL